MRGNPQEGTGQQDGRDLRAARARLGLTQAQLARLAGISREEVGNIERGRVKPYASTVRRLVNALAAAERGEPTEFAPRRPTSPIRSARADSLAAIVGRNGGALRLTDDAYDRLRRLGLSRAAADRACDDLALAGRAQLELRMAVPTIVLAEG